MNDIQNSILEAMQMYAKSAVDKSGSAITIKGKILTIEDAGTGVYTVEYLGNTISVVASNANIVYSVGDYVYIIVPDGDFTKPKFIIGSVSPSASLYSTSTDVSKYISVSNNLFTGVSDINLSSYGLTREDIPYGKAFVGAGDTLNLLAAYFAKYRHFALSMDVKTNLELDQRIKGNYGYILHLPVLSTNADTGEKEHTYKEFQIDITNIQGDPYNFQEWAPQTVYFNLDEQFEIDTTTTDEHYPYITYFCEGFPIQDEAKYLEPIYDIYLRNIGFEIVDVLTEDQLTGYHLTLAATGGEYFLNATETKAIVPTLLIDGKETSYKDKECYWFVEDSSIKIDSDYYSIYGGIGWKCLNERSEVVRDDDGNITSYQLITNGYYLSVPASDILDNLNYKCVIVYDKTLVSNTIELKQLYSDFSLSLVSATGSNVYIKNVGKVDLYLNLCYNNYVKDENKDIIRYEWSRYNMSENYLDNDFYTYEKINDIVEIDGKNFFQTEIKFPCNIIEGMNVVSCSAYLLTATGSKLIGTKKIVISTVENLNYLLSIKNGDVIYKYDADGDSPLGQAYDGPLSSKISTITPLSYKVYKTTGEELTVDEYLYCLYTWIVPKNSMIDISNYYTFNKAEGEAAAYYPEAGNQVQKNWHDKDYWYICGRGNVNNLNYTIVNKFNKTKYNNSVELRVEFNNEVLVENADLKFLKDGDSGTNGTKYAVVIADKEKFGFGERNDKGIEQKISFIYIKGTGWRCVNVNTNTIEAFDSHSTLIPLIYKDGEIINDTNPDVKITYSWFDEKVCLPNFNIVRQDSGKGLSGIRFTVKSELEEGIVNNNCNILQAKVEFNDSQTNSNNVIYAYYPIEITYANDGSVPLIPTFDGGYYEVVYATDGTNPQYDSSKDFSCTDRITADEDLSKYFTFNWSAAYNVSIPNKSVTNQVAIRPMNKYDSGASNNFVKAAYVLSNAEALSADTKAVSDNMADNVAKQNATTAAKEALARLGTAYTHDDWKQRLIAIKPWINARYKAITQLDGIIDIVKNDMLDYYNLEKAQAIDIVELKSYCDRLLDDCEIAKSGLYDLSNTKSLVSYIDSLTWGDYGPSVERQLLVLKANIDAELTNYENLLNDFKANAGADEYQKIAKSFNDSLDEISKTSLLSELSAAAATYNKFYQLSSFASLVEEIIDGCFSEVLSKYLYKDGLTLQLNLYANNYFDELVKGYIAEYELLEKRKNQLDILPKYDGIVHLRPIVLTFDRYGLADLNAWDGNKLYLDENGQYIYSPQMGAGIKNEDNSFTGVIMGKRKRNSFTDVGLFGYANGVQSFFLSAENGSAFFGKSAHTSDGKITPSGGQIIIDPASTSALLYSSIFFRDYNNKTGLPTSTGSGNRTGRGMLIDLTKPEIVWGNGKFKVDENGNLHAENAYIQGDVYAENGYFKGDITGANGTFSGRIEAKSGKIGKWEINSDGLYYGTGYQARLTPDEFAMGNFFLVDRTGAYVKGKIEATEGKIGAWEIEKTTGRLKGSKNGKNIILGLEDITVKDTNSITGSTTFEGPYISTSNWTLTAGENSTFLKLNIIDATIQKTNIIQAMRQSEYDSLSVIDPYAFYLIYDE